MLYGQGKYRYELVEGWAKLPAGESFMDVGGVCTDPQGRVYVLSRTEYPITVFDRDGTDGVPVGKGPLRAGARELHRAGRLDLVHRRPESHGVQVHPGGKLLKTMGTKDTPSDTGYHEAADLFERLASITHGGAAVQPPDRGRLRALGGDLHRGRVRQRAGAPVQRATASCISSWGEPGPGPSQFRLPHNLWVDKSNRVWVADRENSRIQIFREDGKFLAQWTDLFRPTGVCIDKDDIVYVSELCMRISVFDMDGEAAWRDGGTTGTWERIVCSWRPT